MSNTNLDNMIAVLSSFDLIAQGDDIARDAQEWLDCGFSPSEADKWADAHFWSAYAAANALDAGISPREVIELGLQYEVGYAMSNYDIDADEALALIEAAR